MRKQIHPHSKSILATTFVVGLFLIIPQAYGTHASSIAHGIAQYHGKDCDPDNDATNIPFSDNWAAKWDDVVDDWVDDGYMSQSVVYTNDTTDAYDLRDASYGGGDDGTQGIDNYDIGLFSGHGNCSHPSGMASTGCYEGSARSTLYFGDDGGESICSASTINDIRLGDEDSNMFFAAACFSAQYAVRSAGGYRHLTGGYTSTLQTVTHKA